MTTADKNPYAARGPPPQDDTFDYDYYDPHCFFSSGLAQNRRRLGFIATCSSVQCKSGGSEGYDPLLPFKEDLAEWLYKMIRADINPDQFFQELQSGVHVCKLGIHMQKCSVKWNKEHPKDIYPVPNIPPRLKYANATRKSPSFYCRDNISNFLSWSIEFGVKQSCRFETDDLTMRKNDRQIILHLMEVGRLGVRYGIEPPTLIKLEMDIEEEIAEPKPEPEPEPEPVPAVSQPKPKGVSFLDEQVQALAAECNCSVPFKVVRVSEGKYKVGEGRSIVFVRVLRSHVMVRVGGGWETLQAYFSKMDPCRSPVDSFGRGGPGTNKVKQRFESNESIEEAKTPPPKPVEAPPPPPAVLIPEPQVVEMEVEVDAPPVIQKEEIKPIEAVPPVKPKRPSSVRKTTPVPVKTARSKPAPVPVQSKPAPIPQQKRKLALTAAKSAPSPITSSTSTPTKAKSVPPTPHTQYAYVRNTSQSDRTPSPSAIKTTPTGKKAKVAPKMSVPTDGKLPPWRNVAANTPSPAPRPLSQTFSTPSPTKSTVSKTKLSSPIKSAVGPSTRGSSKAPPAPKAQTFKFNRGTQSTRRPKITSPELIRRAMQIMGDNGNQEQEDAVRTPSNEAIEAAKEEIRDESDLYDEEESVTVEMITPSDSGLGTAQPEKIVVEDITLEESTQPIVSGYDTLQDISDMMTDDKSLLEELDRYDDLPHDGATESRSIGRAKEDYAPAESPQVVSSQTSQKMEELKIAQQELEDTIINFKREYSIEELASIPAPALEPEYVEPQIKEAVSVEPQIEGAKYVEPQIYLVTYVEPQIEVAESVEPQIEEIRYVEPQVEDTKSAYPQIEETASVEPQIEEVKYVEPQIEEAESVESRIEEAESVEPQIQGIEYVEPQIEVKDVVEETIFEEDEEGEEDEDERWYEDKRVDEEGNKDGKVEEDNKEDNKEEQKEEQELKNEKVEEEVTEPVENEPLFDLFEHADEEEEQLPLPLMEVEDLEIIPEDIELEVSSDLVQDVAAEPVVMKPNKTPLPNNNNLNITKPIYASDSTEDLSQITARNEAFVEELKSMKGQPKRSQHTSGHLSDSDRSTASEKGVSDSSSGYHEDYETSDGEPLGLDTAVPDVIMEIDDSTRSILKGSVREQTTEPTKRNLSQSASLSRDNIPENEIDEDSVFSIDEEARAKGMNLPSEGHVREAVFTKAIEAAIHPLAGPEITIPFMGDVQSASLVLPSKKAIRKASDGEYNYDGRRSNLEKVISNQHTEKKDMEWDGDETFKGPDGQTRDEQISKWSGTLRSSQKKKKTGQKKKEGSQDALSAIERQVNFMRSNCPVHSKEPNAPMGHTQSKPVTRSASTPAKVRPRVVAKSPSAVTSPPPKTIPRTISTATPKAREVMDINSGSQPSGPLTPNLDNMNKTQLPKSVPVKRTSSLKGTGRKTPLKSSTLPRDKIRAGPTCRDLP